MPKEILKRRRKWKSPPPPAMSHDDDPLPPERAAALAKREAEFRRLLNASMLDKMLVKKKPAP